MADDSEASVGTLISKIEQGDSAKIAELLTQYLPRLEKLSRKLLAGYPAAAVGPEDIAHSTLKSFVRLVGQNQVSSFSSHEALWKFLAQAARFKASKRKRDERALKRGGGKVTLATDLDLEEGATPIMEATGGDLQAVDLDLACSERLEMLPDDTFRTVTLLRFRGHTNAEISEIMEISLSKVERKVALIKKIWATEDGHQ